MSTEWTERVYLIGSTDLLTAKIGRSVDLGRRLYSIQLMSPVRLEVLWSCEGGKDLERALHDHFASYWSHGEWFTFPDDPARRVREAAEQQLMDVSAQPADHGALKLSGTVGTPPRPRTAHWNPEMPLVITPAVVLYLRVRRTYGDGPFTYAEAASVSSRTESETRGQVRRLQDLGLVEPAGSVPGSYRGSRRRRFIAHRLPPGARLGHRSGTHPGDVGPDDLAFALDLGNMNE